MIMNIEQDASTAFWNLDDPVHLNWETTSLRNERSHSVRSVYLLNAWCPGPGTASCGPCVSSTASRRGRRGARGGSSPWSWTPSWTRGEYLAKNSLQSTIIAFFLQSVDPGGGHGGRHQGLGRGGAQGAGARSVRGALSRARGLSTKPTRVVKIARAITLKHESSCNPLW